MTVYFELDTGGNVRRLHAGERITGAGAFTGDLGGYAYTAFGRPIAATDPGGVAIPKIDGVDYFQRIQWQGRWLYNRSGGLYNFRARFWSPQLGAFLQLDQYQFLSSGGTLWSWPGQNPFRWRDPSGRDAEEWFLRNGEDLAAGVGAVAVAPLALYTLASWGAVAAGDWALAESAGLALRGYSAAVGLAAGGKAATDAASRGDGFATGMALGAALSGAGVIGEGLGSGPRVNCPTGGSPSGARGGTRGPTVPEGKAIKVDRTPDGLIGRERPLTSEQARTAVNNGQDVYAPDRATAQDVAGRRAVGPETHPVDGETRFPHFHRADRVGGHIFFGEGE